MDDEKPPEGHVRGLLRADPTPGPRDPQTSKGHVRKGRAVVPKPEIADGENDQRATSASERVGQLEWELQLLGGRKCRGRGGAVLARGAQPPQTSQERRELCHSLLLPQDARDMLGALMRTAADNDRHPGLCAVHRAPGRTPPGRTPPAGPRAPSGAARRSQSRPSNLSRRRSRGPGRRPSDANSGAGTARAPGHGCPFIHANSSRHPTVSSDNHAGEQISSRRSRLRTWRLRA